MNRWLSKAYQEDLKSICDENLPFEKLADCRILVTGATGLIGSFLVDALMYLKLYKSMPIKVDILCRNKERAEGLFEEYLNDADFRILKGDLTKEIQTGEEYDYVIHGAGNNHPVAFSKEPVETMKAALLGTMNLLDALVKQRKQDAKFLLLSTGEVYGKTETCEGGNCEEAIGIVDPMNPRSCYPEAKRAAETLCVSYGQEYGIQTNVVRLSYIFGATFQNESTKADVQFLQKAISGNNIVMKSAGSQYRSYCYLADAIRGIFYIMLKGSSGEAYNVSNPETNVTIREFAETLARIAGVQVVFENPDDVEQKGYSKLSRECLNPEKLKGLGYVPKVGLEDAFRRILDIRRRCGNEE